MFETGPANLMLLLLLAGISGCSDGKGPAESGERAATASASAADGLTPPATGSFVLLRSDPGEHVGDGNTRLYTSSNSSFNFFPDASEMTLFIKGEENWTGDFRLPESVQRFEVGTYRQMPGMGEDQDKSRGRLAWYNKKKGCADSIGTLVIDKVAYDGDDLSHIEMSFEQTCLTSNPDKLTLHGTIRWDDTD